jgi:hypothetical protein
MYKKYFNLKKIKGVTEVYFVFKYAEFFSNRRLNIPTNNFIPLNPALIDHTNNSFVFHANQIEKIKTYNFIVSLEMNESNQLERLLPVPFEHITKSLTKNERARIDELKKINYDCQLEVFQVYMKSSN